MDKTENRVTEKILRSNAHDNNAFFMELKRT